VARRHGYGADIPRSTGRQRLVAFGNAIPALILPVVIVGGVRFGVFTATEAGAMAFIFAILCGALVYRCLTVRNFSEAVREATFDTVAIAFIIAAAAPFAWILAAEQVPQKIAATLSALSSSPVILLLLINLFLLVVGLFMEMIAALVILVPILVPIVVAAGYDPIQFGIVLVLNLVIGALTPPLGMLVFITARVGQVDVPSVFRAALPFIGALIGVLMLITFIPALSLGPLRWFSP
jgi:C4-dicarboxylate transporter DctM subunit